MNIVTDSDKTNKESTTASNTDQIKSIALHLSAILVRLNHQQK